MNYYEISSSSSPSPPPSVITPPINDFYYNTFVSIVSTPGDDNHRLPTDNELFNSDNLFSNNSQKNGNNSSDRRKNRSIPVVNQPIQALLLTLILISAILTNGSVILNISRDSLKLRMVHFLLIRHVCITDSIGALMVLPVPLISFIKGYWDWGETSCTVISTTTACCWTMHLVAVALYRADRVFAVWLPTGRYPVISARVVNGLLVLIWLGALSGSYLATYTFTPTFQPALALCIPNVPLIFFILVFSSYILGLIILTTGYVVTFIRRRRKRRHHKKQQQLDQPNHHHHHHRHSSAQAAAPPKQIAKSTPNLHVTNVSSSPSIVVILNNNPPPPPKSPRTVAFLQTSNSIISTSPSSSSCPTTTNNSSQNVTINTRALTPPPPKSQSHQPQTHRRVHSEPFKNSVVIVNTPANDGGCSSNDSVSVQYRTLNHHNLHNDNTSEDYTAHEAEESVAEKLDECDVTGISNSSNNNEDDDGVNDAINDNDDEAQPNHHHHHHETVPHSHSARCRVISSYAVSIGHLILYLPAMLVVGLLGQSLPPAIAFVCGLVVYCEFIVQPIALLLVSPKLRGEVVGMIRGYVRSAAVRVVTRVRRGSGSGGNNRNSRGGRGDLDNDGGGDLEEK